MSTVFLLPDDSSQDVIAFDVTLAENHHGESEPTENPLEDGSIANDHIIHKPDPFVFDAMVTNTPSAGNFYETANTLAKVTISRPAGQDGANVPGSITVTGTSVEREANRIQEMWDRLERARLAGTTFTVLTTIKEYISMVISIVDLNREQLSIGMGRFHVEMKHMNFVATEKAQAPKPKEPRGAKLVSKGAQSGEDKTQAIAEMLGLKPGKSGLVSIIDGDLRFPKVW